MTFKELFDQALAQCTTFANDMNNARYDFEKHVNDLLDPIVKDNELFDQIRCSISYGRDCNPRIALIMNSTPSTNYINTSLITFRLKLERGPKHHSYYDDWYEYKVKSYSDISILDMNDEDSALLFDTTEILTLIEKVLNECELFKQYQQAQINYQNFVNTVETEHKDLISQLTEVLNAYKALDYDTRHYINDKVYNITELRIRDY